MHCELVACLQVRGASSPRDEMAYIMRHSQSSAVILQDPETLDKLLPVLSAPAEPSNGSGKVRIWKLTSQCQGVSCAGNIAGVKENAYRTHATLLLHWPSLFFWWTRQRHAASMATCMQAPASHCMNFCLKSAEESYPTEVCWSEDKLRQSLEVSALHPRILVRVLRLGQSREHSSHAGHLMFCMSTHMGDVLQPLHEAIKFAICLWGEPIKEAQQKLACKVLSFQDVLDAGAATVDSFQMANIQPDDLATFVYTSGTTGNPKVGCFIWLF